MQVSRRPKTEAPSTRGLISESQLVVETEIHRVEQEASKAKSRPSQIFEIKAFETQRSPIEQQQSAFLSNL